MSYLEDTNYAASSLIDLITQQQIALDKTKEELSGLMKKFKHYHWDYTTSDLNDDFSEAHVMNAFHNMAKSKTHVDELEAIKLNLEATIGSEQLAIQALAGALLQIAKQGISVVHGGLQNAPDGRQVDGVELKNLVWQARNQALHFEDGSFSQHVNAVFSTLQQTHGAKFDLSVKPSASLAKQVVYLLGWNKIDAYKDDMKSLGLA
ncbi:hypothetical protein MXMO3_00028 [Maritalea myrionectae]|uniref:Uncharacterized protein n=1 Tax=Maritalea myrionectae TaxID=454601 RepID=A0A2R4M9N5_9HYPH|nr:hypothetical protein [Maritalea myrionectae]AVX02576.1 hypothetical protein MXMO3_00028 [Maritalea myrionectae]